MRHSQKKRKKKKMLGNQEYGANKAVILIYVSSIFQER